ncbi:MAG TPA: substrate import-associated zinc metallohydrolase lipoprotein [Chryseolinea sp.]|nr:substrate import-associated zinc metallohydrolase lipoprotein [Chryseolinea sp.]
MNIKFLSIFLIILGVAASCYKDESVESPVKDQPFSTDPIDVFIQSNFIDKYGVAVRYKFIDRYLEPDKRVAPVKRELVEPMLNFLTSFWIEPYIGVNNGRRFFENHVPAEVIFIGSPIFNDDGTQILGLADAGARITLTEVNDIDPENLNWVFRQLGTIYHEFAHIVHQRYNLPPNWQQISPQGYTSPGSWYNITDDEALQRGFVSPYASSSYNEDYAETVAFILFFPTFYETYINDTPNCTTPDCIARNEGKARLRTKYNAILSHYEQVTGVDLLAVRAIIQDKLN